MNLLSNLLLVPLEDLVVFPNMSVTLTVDVGDEERVLLVPKHEGEFAKVGTVAEVVDHVRLPGGGRAVELLGLHRGVAGAVREVDGVERLGERADLVHLHQDRVGGAALDALPGAVDRAVYFPPGCWQAR